MLNFSISIIYIRDNLHKSCSKNLIFSTNLEVFILRKLRKWRIYEKTFIFNVTKSAYKGVCIPMQYTA
ncbi:hypothetical protein ciss_19730 [Carboxydothermus islandicus]|uniref:Uncharacterized protein n=1 Tax=Carboxydothermus islandicus TaxID=661089 RepID=A0A1L8D4E0_9THEO|nr:hypothetical protein ciss_19730 [Carboxydothermus islandicus]